MKRLSRNDGGGKALLNHFLIVFVGLFLLVLVPLVASGFFAYLKGGADAVSSASVKIDSPSGNFIIFINNAMHKDDEKLYEWEKFFRGDDISYIFEDITCSVARGDESALEMAESFMSRLPENQMRIKTEDALLLVSRAEYGLYDIIIMTEEMARVHGVRQAPDATTIEYGGESA